MPPELSDEALAFLLARAGIPASADQTAELKAAYGAVAEMAARVRRPRTHMAEPAHHYAFAEADLS